MNETLLSALEVRVLPSSAVDRLESARGLLLRRLFGKNGYGKVAGQTQPVSVTISMLRARCGLASVITELRVRRLLWLRASLAAESAGEIRLELAALFGKFPWQAQEPVAPSGCLTDAAPAFLHVLLDDLRAICSGFSGFSPGWKAAVLAISTAEIQALRTCDLECPIHGDKHVDCHPSPHGEGPVETAVASEMPTSTPRAVLDVQGEVVSLAVLGDGRTPEGTILPADWLQGVFCGDCASGPWHSFRAFASHVMRKHKVKSSIQSKARAYCDREFTSITACRRHMKNRSCGSIVCNHGHAGAIAGEREQRHRASTGTDFFAAFAQPPCSNSVDAQWSHGAVLHGRRGSTSGGTCERQAKKGSLQWFWSQAKCRQAGGSIVGAAQGRDEPCESARPGPEGVRSVVDFHLPLEEGHTSRSGAAEGHAGLEGQASGEGCSSIRSSSLGSGRGFGAVACAGRGATEPNAALLQLSQRPQAALGHGVVGPTRNGSRDEGSESTLEGATATDQTG